VQSIQEVTRTGSIVGSIRIRRKQQVSLLSRGGFWDVN